MYDNTIVQPVVIENPAYVTSDSFFEWLFDLAIRFFSVNWLNVMYVLLSLIVIALITISLYVLVRLYEIKQEDKKKEKSITPSSGAQTPPSGPTAIETMTQAPRHNETWEHIRNRILSDNQSDWRLAIIEADIYMDRMFDAKGFHGDTVGDKLKQITPEQFGAVQIAWEAHKVRNRIAHDGADFTLTMPEARRVLSYYEIVFRDLGVID